jgi:chorismate mutase
MKPTDEYQDHPLSEQPPNPYDLVQRLRKRAEIRRQISTRKSVQNNEPDRIADLLEEAADQLTKYKHVLESIANEYVELSHDKIKWQCDDHIRWAKEALK